MSDQATIVHRGGTRDREMAAYDVVGRIEWLGGDWYLVMAFAQPLAGGSPLTMQCRSRSGSAVAENLATIVAEIQEKIRSRGDTVATVEVDGFDGAQAPRGASEPYQRG